MLRSTLASSTLNFHSKQLRSERLEASSSKSVAKTNIFGIIDYSCEDLIFVLGIHGMSRREHAQVHMRTLQSISTALDPMGAVIQYLETCAS